jgi:hypothetical protein
VAFQYGQRKALRVREAAIANLDEREAEFLYGMLEDVVVDTPALEGLTLDELRSAYEDNYDEIWLDDGGLDEDNARHEADDYYNGYVAGSRMVLELLRETFGLAPEDLPDTTKGV